MRTKSIAFLLVTSLLIGFISCDPYGEYDYWLDNRSDSALFVAVKAKYTTQIDWIKVNKQSSKQLRQIGTFDGLHDLGNNFLTTYFDSIRIYIDTVNRIQIKKDPQLRSNWIYQKHTTGLFHRSGNNIYLFTVLNSDL